MRTPSLQELFLALACVFFLALGVSDGSAQALSPVSSNQKSARIAAFQALRKQENAPAVMPKPQHLVLFRSLKPASTTRPKITARPRLRIA